jgi:hypothetical protein
MDPSARAMNPPVDNTEEVLASLASPRMAAHLRESLRATGHFAPYGEIRYDGDDTQSSEDEALAAAEADAADAEEEVLMLRALVRAIAARPPGRARANARANADDDARPDARTHASSHPRRRDTRASGSFPRAPRFPAAETRARRDANAPANASANAPANASANASAPLAPDVSAVRPRRGVGAPRWGPPPPRRPAAASARAPAAVRAATARAVASVLGDAPQPGGVADAIADVGNASTAPGSSSSTSDLTAAFAATRRRVPAAIIHRATTRKRIDQFESTSTSAKGEGHETTRRRREPPRPLRGGDGEGGDAGSRLRARRPGALALATKPKPKPKPKPNLTTRPFPRWASPSREKADASVSSATNVSPPAEDVSARDVSADDVSDDDADAWWNRPFGDVRGGAGLSKSPPAVRETGAASRSRAVSASASVSATPSACASKPPRGGRCSSAKSSWTFMLSPEALARALDRTRPAFSSRGATRWVPPPSQGRVIFVAVERFGRVGRRARAARASTPRRVRIRAAAKTRGGRRRDAPPRAERPLAAEGRGGRGQVGAPAEGDGTNDDDDDDDDRGC